MKNRNQKVGVKKARKMFVQWLGNRDPALLMLAEKRYLAQQKMGLAGLSGFWDSLQDTVTNIAPTLVSMAQQKQIMDMQMRRAREGLPPADVADYTPAVKVDAVITPETEAALTRIATETARDSGAQMVKYIMPVALAGAAFLVLRKK